MSYQVLARKWRPQTFDEVVGQPHIVKTLTNAIKKKRTAHVYLFSGGRGLGKTSMARILAKGLNCENGPTPTPCNSCSICSEVISGTSVDVVEIDGASNTGVDDIRELKEDVRYIPLKGRYKIYIIDEVHMLSNSAFNALLKILEEPPPHVLFIFATTEAHKIPPTILSRCQHFNFKRISYQEIIKRLEFIAKAEFISIDKGALSVIARSSEGSMRDALILLDQIVSYCGKEVKQDDIGMILGMAGRERLSEFTNAIASKDAKIVLELLGKLIDNSIDIKVFSREFVEYIRDLLVAKIMDDTETLIERPKEEIDLIRAEAGLFSIDELQRLFSIFQQAQDEIARSSYPRFILEVAAIKAAKLRPLKPIEDIVKRLSELEKQISTSISGHSKDVEIIEEKTEKDRIPTYRAGREGEGTAGSNPLSWENVLTVIGERRPNLHSYLEKGMLLDITDDDIKIGYDDSNSVMAELLRRGENIAFIESVIKELSGKERRVRITRLLNRQGTKERSDPVGEPSEKKKSGPDNIIVEALNILGGEVVDTRRSERRREDVDV